MSHYFHDLADRLGASRSIGATSRRCAQFARAARLSADQSNRNHTISVEYSGERVAAVATKSSPPVALHIRRMQGSSIALYLAIPAEKWSIPSSIANWRN